MRSPVTIGLLLLALLPAAARATEPVAAWIRPAAPPQPVAGLLDAAPAPAAPSPPPVDFGLAPGQSLHAVLRTTLGAIDCTLNVDEAPVSVRTFVDLARGLRPWVDPRTGAEVLRPLYDGTVFHRVIPGFLIQGGDPTGTGTGGPGFSIPDEIGAERQFDRAGLLALANRGPNTNGSQFFVTDGPAHHLDGRYTRLGTCTNLDVIAAIARVPRGERNRPVSPPVLRAVEIAAR